MSLHNLKYMDVSNDYLDNINKRLMDEIDRNTKLRNQIADLVKEREALINDIERLRSELLYFGH